jgi:hypothetical protein
LIGPYSDRRESHKQPLRKFYLSGPMVSRLLVFSGSLSLRERVGVRAS